MAEILKELTSVMSDNVSFEIDIRRTHVLEDSMREAKKAKFSTLKRIQVVSQKRILSPSHVRGC